MVNDTVELKNYKKQPQMYHKDGPYNKNPWRKEES